MTYALILGLKYSKDDLMNIMTTSKNNSYGKNEEIDDFDEDLKEKEKKDFFDNGEFTLRRHCGRSIESLANIFHDEIFF